MSRLFDSDIKQQFQFLLKSSGANCTIERITSPLAINQDSARSVLVESFIGEYQQYLQPNEIDKSLTSWRDGEHSVQSYYEHYFEDELNDFSDNKINYWVQATVASNGVGWATFQRENEHAVYMNLLVVDPNYQKQGIGQYLVNSLIHLNAIPELTAIHLLLRRKNQGGRAFYSKLGFHSDPDYQRSDNFVDTNLLEGWTWEKPAPQLQALY